MRLSNGPLIILAMVVVFGVAAVSWIEPPGTLSPRQPSQPPQPPSAAERQPAAEDRDTADHKDKTSKPEAKDWQPPKPPGASEFAKKRAKMVQNQIARAWDFRTGVKSPRVLDAVRTVPRHRFVPPSLRGRAHADSPLPIGHGQTISQPYMVALMTELLGLTPESKVLEVGTGSGYQAAVLAHLTPHVYTVEIIKPLAKQALKVLREQGYGDIQCRRGDGYFGWKEEAPFDAIIVTCAAGHLPPPLWEQLKPGGQIAIPIGGPREIQRLVLITKTKKGERRSRTITQVRFVPLTRGDAP